MFEPESAPCVWFAFSDDGLITHANGELARLLGYGREEIEGRPLSTLFTSSARLYFHLNVVPTLKHLGQVEEVSLAMRGKGGEEVPVLLNAVRRPRQGAVVGEV